jgi:hypothetical protein
MKVTVTGVDIIIKRLNAFPKKFNESLLSTMKAALQQVREKMPAYPPAPVGSRYKRTGKLGRSLGVGGSGMGGGAGGRPSIYKIQKFGAHGVVGTLGSNVEYAEYVVGENQAGMHSSNWWKLSDVLWRAMDKIERLWNQAAEALAAFLDGG